MVVDVGFMRRIHDMMVGFAVPISETNKEGFERLHEDHPCKSTPVRFRIFVDTLVVAPLIFVKEIVGLNLSGEHIMHLAIASMLSPLLVGELLEAFFDTVMKSSKVLKRILVNAGVFFSIDLLLALLLIAGD